MSAAKRQSNEVGYSNLLSRAKELLIGQDAALERIVPYIEVYQAQLCPSTRPVGVFLLLGKTGCGKTKTAEVLAECLHGSSTSLTRIDCGEMRNEHEVARILGAPSGYLGHRETPSLLSTKTINDTRSGHSSLAIIVFDEIEKAATSLQNVLLGVFDKAQLTLGDASKVPFKDTIIFLTSNLGAKELKQASDPSFGFSAYSKPMTSAGMGNVGTGAAKKTLLPEFINRLDEIITYNDLSRENLGMIVENEIQAVQDLVTNNHEDRAWEISYDQKVVDYLIDNGFSKEYGARPIKRLIHQAITLPMARLVNAGKLSKKKQAYIYAQGGKLLVSVDNP